MAVTVAAEARMPAAIREHNRGRARAAHAEKIARKPNGNSLAAFGPYMLALISKGTQRGISRRS
jgi:hypothetical protein